MRMQLRYAFSLSQSSGKIKLSGKLQFRRSQRLIRRDPISLLETQEVTSTAVTGADRVWEKGVGRIYQRSGAVAMGGDVAIVFQLSPP